MTGPASPPLPSSHLLHRRVLGYFDLLLILGGLHGQGDGSGVLAALRHGEIRPKKGDSGCLVINLSDETWEVN